MFPIPLIKSPSSFILGAIVGVASILLYWYLRHRKAQRFLDVFLAHHYADVVVSPRYVLYTLRQGKWQSTNISDPPPVQILTFQDLFLCFQPLSTYRRRINGGICISVTGPRRLLWEASFVHGNLERFVFRLWTASRKYRPQEIPQSERQALENIYALLSNTASS